MKDNRNPYLTDTCLTLTPRYLHSYKISLFFWINFNRCYCGNSKNMDCVLARMWLQRSIVNSLLYYFDLSTTIYFMVHHILKYTILFVFSLCCIVFRMTSKKVANVWSNYSRFLFFVFCCESNLYIVKWNPKLQKGDKIRFQCTWQET